MPPCHCVTWGKLLGLSGLSSLLCKPVPSWCECVAAETAWCVSRVAQRLVGAQSV